MCIHLICCHYGHPLLTVQGLVDAYVANSQQAKAVNYLNTLRDKILAQAAPSSAAEAAEAAATAPSSSNAVVEGAGGSGSESSSVAGAASTSDRVMVDPVGVQLLLGKAPQLNAYATAVAVGKAAAIVCHSC